MKMQFEKFFDERKYFFSCVLILFLFEVISIFLFYSKNIVFFICFFSILGLTFYFLLIYSKFDWKRNKYLIIFLILIISLSVKLFFIFRYEGFFLDSDCWYQVPIINGIIENHHYYDVLSDYVYHAGPGNHLFVVFIQYLTGLDTFTILRFYIPLFTALFPIVYFILFKNLFSNDYRIAAIATILYSLTSEFIWMNFRGEFLIAPLLIIAVYFLFIYVKQKKVVYIVLFTTMTFVVNISHASFYCVLFIPVITTITIYFAIKKDLNYQNILIIFLIIILTPLIFVNLFPNTTSGDYIFIASIYTQFLNLDFLFDYLNILIIFTLCALILSFTLFTIIIHGLFNLLHKYFENTKRKILLTIGLIGLIAIGIIIFSIIGHINFIDVLSLRYISGIYPDLITFFLFYSFYILIFIIGIICFLKIFKTDHFKNWALTLAAILIIIIIVTNFNLGFTLPSSLDWNIPIRILFFLSFPICILTSRWIISTVKNTNLSKIYATLIIFLIIFGSYFSLAKATHDTDILSENLVMTKNEEIAVRSFLAALENETIVWVDYKFKILIYGLASFEEFELMKTKIDIKLLLQYNLSEIDTILHWYQTYFLVNNSYIFLPNYLELGNLTQYLIDNYTIYYQNPEVRIIRVDT